MPEPVNEQDKSKVFDKLISDIMEGKCALVIGPEIILSQREKNFLQDFKKFLGVKIPEEVMLWEEGFFYFKDELEERNTYEKLEEFYNTVNDASIYEKLLQIPFRLIISLSPDTILKKIAQEKNYKIQFDYYKRVSGVAVAPKPAVAKASKDSMLVYNLFGTIEDPESLVLTFNALFEYLTSILGDHKLDDTVRTSLNQVKRFVLLGFDYEKWYFKLLFKLITNKAYAYRDAYYESQTVSEDIRSFYLKDLKINFIENHPKKFIGQLYQYFYDQKELRRPMTAPETFLDKIDDSLYHDNFEDAFNEMLGKSASGETQNEIKTLRNRWKDTSDKFGKTIVGEQQGAEKTKMELIIREMAREIAGEEEKEK